MSLSMVELLSRNVLGVAIGNLARRCSIYGAQVTFLFIANAVGPRNVVDHYSMSNVSYI